MVEYEPPENLKPAEIGTLVDEYADDRDIVATIIDLAIRGYLKIKPLGDKDVEIEILREGDELEGYERKVFEAIKECAEDGKVLRLGEGVKYYIYYIRTIIDLAIRGYLKIEPLED
jgi:hypothetical protein